MTRPAQEATLWGQMNPTFVLGRIAGVRVGLNWTWTIVFALIVWSLAASVFPSWSPGLPQGEYVAMALAAALLFFASLLLHELGHALQARREGLYVDSITLWLLGGVAQFRGGFPGPGAELRVALAGPGVSAVLGGAFLALAAGTHVSAGVDGVAAWLAYVNLMLLAFNLLPALPLDGGRVFRSLLWRARRDFAWATRIAVDVSRVLAVGLIALGFTVLLVADAVGGLWLAFVGWFLLQAASFEARELALREALAGLRVRDLMRPYPAALVWAYRLGAGRTPPSPDVPALEAGDPALYALDLLATSPGGRAVVVEEGTPVGEVSLSDVVHVLARPRPPGAARLGYR